MRWPSRRWLTSPLAALQRPFQSHPFQQRSRRMLVISFQFIIGVVVTTRIAGMAVTTGTAGMALTTVTDTIGTAIGGIGDRKNQREVTARLKNIRDRP